MPIEFEFKFKKPLGTEVSAIEMVALLRKYAGATEVEVARLDGEALTAPELNKGSIEEYPSQGLARRINRSFAGYLDNLTPVGALWGKASDDKPNFRAGYSGWSRIPFWSDVYDSATDKEREYISTVLGRIPENIGSIIVFRNSSLKFLITHCGIPANNARFLIDMFEPIPGANIRF
jgi:hypothetical protein